MQKIDRARRKNENLYLHSLCLKAHYYRYASRISKCDACGEMMTDTLYYIHTSSNGMVYDLCETCHFECIAIVCDRFWQQTKNKHQR